MSNGEEYQSWHSCHPEHSSYPLELTSNFVFCLFAGAAFSWKLRLDAHNQLRTANPLEMTACMLCPPPCNGSNKNPDPRLAQGEVAFRAWDSLSILLSSDKSVWLALKQFGYIICTWYWVEKEPANLVTFPVPTFEQRLKVHGIMRIASRKLTKKMKTRVGSL